MIMFISQLPSKNCSAEWSGWVWQPSADSNGLLGHHYCQQRTVTPDPESFNSNKKGTKLPLLSAEDCHTLLDGQHCPLRTHQCMFSKGGYSHLFLMNKKGLRAGKLFLVWHDDQSLVPGSQFLRLCLPTPSQQSRMVLFTPARPLTTACFCTQPFPTPHWAGGRVFQSLSYLLNLAVKVLLQSGSAVSHS
jgi:hypothetical protein